MEKGLNIFVFGGTGFIGKQLCQDLNTKKIKFSVVRISSSVCKASNEVYIKDILKKYKTQKNAQRSKLNILVNLAHAPSNFNKNSKKINISLINQIITFGKLFDNCILLHATSEAQYNSQKNSWLHNDPYLSEKRIVSDLIKKSGLNYVNICIASAISNKFNSRSGLDYFIKSSLYTDKFFLVIPDINVRIQTNQEISSKIIFVIENITRSNNLSKLFSDTEVVSLYDLISNLVPKKFIIKIGTLTLKFMSVLGSLLIHTKLSSTVLNYERILYYKNLSMSYSKKDRHKRIIKISSYLSSLIR